MGRVGRSSVTPVASAAASTARAAAGAPSPCSAMPGPGRSNRLISCPLPSMPIGAGTRGGWDIRPGSGPLSRVASRRRPAASAVCSESDTGLGAGPVCNGIGKPRRARRRCCRRSRAATAAMVAARPRLTQPCDGMLTPCSYSSSCAAGWLAAGWGEGAAGELPTDADGAGVAGSVVAGGLGDGGGFAGGAGGGVCAGGMSGAGLPPASPAGGGAAGLRAGRTSTHPMWISSGSVRA